MGKGGKNKGKGGAKVVKATPQPAWKSDENIDKYSKGTANVSVKNIKHKSLRKTLEETRDRNKTAAINTAATEILLPADSGFIEVDSKEKVFQIKQRELVHNVDLNTAKNRIDFQLTKFGPYNIDFSRNGRILLFGGKRGHIATYDCLRTEVGMELQLEEEVHDVHFLHNETMFAAAQQKYTYIYDHKGVELHCMKRHERPYKLDYLPYHYLLTTVGHSGWIKWHDVSIGEYLCGYQTGHGPCKILKHNPINAVSHVGHSNGVVSLWSPAAGKALVSMFCHKAPLTDLAIDREGKYMATAGLDGTLKIWDLRKYQALHTYKMESPIMSMDISAKGLIGVATGRNMQVLRNAFTQPMDITYLQEEIRTPNAALAAGGGATAAAKALKSRVSISSVLFRPYEDLLCAGHSHGISTIIVPGAGEPNFDSFESNPFINPKQRREQEVQTLLTKLSHEMIGLDASFIGSVEKDKETLMAEHTALFTGANKTELDKKPKNRMRGRNKISAKLRRKQKNVIDAQLLKLKDKQKEEREAKEKKSKAEVESTLGALARFKR